MAMFMILCSNAFSVALVCYLALCALVTADGMLLADKIVRRDKVPPLLSRSRLYGAWRDCWRTLRTALHRWWGCCCGCCSVSSSLADAQHTGDLHKPFVI